MRLAQAQINPTVGELAGNLALVADRLAKAKLAKADLVSFGELALCGYPPEDLLLKPRFRDDCLGALMDLLPLTKDITAVVGLPHWENGRCYNAAAVLADGQLAGIYHKIELPNYGVFDEKRYFEPGGGSLFLDIAGWRVLVTICEDIWIPGSPVEAAAKEGGARLALNISGSPFHAGKPTERLGVAARFAAATGCYVAYNNLVGGQDELVFDGGGLVMDPAGQVLAASPLFEEDLLLVDLDPPAGEQQPSPRQRHCLVRAPAAPSEKPPLPPASQIDPLDAASEVMKALVLGTRDYLRKNGFQKALIGLSGGVDSSLVAAVAVEALGAENVLGVTMPSRYTSEGTLTDAGRLAQNLGMEMLTIPIGPMMATFQAEMAEALGPPPYGVEMENLQARVRGNILMTLSNRFGHMVLTTGNKSETAVGYCTLYGDMAGGFAVIKDVPKTLVYRVCQRINQEAGRDLVPESVMTRPPSAELAPDQKDSDSLPPYEVLDPILKAYVEEDKVAAEIVDMGFDPADVDRVVWLVDINEYKRRQAPPGVKITPKAFGRDRRLPISNHYRPKVKP